MSKTYDKYNLKPYGAVPNERQMEWYGRGRTIFFHFGMNTFTGKEWGDGTEDPSLFNPTELDVEQWVKAIKAGGFSLFSYFRRSFLLDCAKKSAVYAAFQLPFALFYFFFGFDAFYTTGIEKFYALEVGVYLWMDSAILGMVLSVTLFFVCSSCADFVLLVINYRYVMENTPTLSEMK